MKSIAALAVSALVVGAVAVPAQSFTSLGSPDNVSSGEQYWDNVSTDGVSCNSGYVVTGVAGTAGNACNNQRPSGWLPYTGPVPTSYWNLGGGFSPFLFASGSYTFSLLLGTAAPGGDIAGMNTDWGYYDFNTLTRTSLNSGLPGGPVDMLGTWGLWIQLTNGSDAYSGENNQFALFGFGASPASGPDWIAGMEDVYTGTGGGSDKDYQDVMFAIHYNEPAPPEEIIPEPATMTLLATGLAGLAVAKRRKRV